MSCHVLSCDVIFLCRVISGDVMPCHVMSSHVWLVVKSCCVTEMVV